MPRSISLTVLLALFASCSTRFTAPTTVTDPASPALIGGEGTLSTTAVTTERIRLRRVGGADIVTSLATGQVIDVPLNVNLDIWAEVPRRYRGKGPGCYEKRATDPVGLRRLRRIAGGAVMMAGEEAPMPDLSQMVSS